MPLTRRRLLSSMGAAAAAATTGSIRTSPAAATAAFARPFGSDAAAFLHAVEVGDLGEVRRLLAADAALAAARDPQGRSAFVLAHLSGRKPVADELRGRIELDAVEAVLAEDWARFGALARASPEPCNAVRSIGGTPLYAAALVGSGDLSRLRSAGCPPEAAPAGGSGFTPARAAMQCRTVSGARCAATDLLGNGADVNAAQRGGDSVLHGAVRRRSELLVRLAIRKGADPDARDGDGRDARELAEHLGWTAGAALLAGHARLPRDHRESRWRFGVDRRPVVRPGLRAREHAAIASMLERSRRQAMTRPPDGSRPQALPRNRRFANAPSPMPASAAAAPTAPAIASSNGNRLWLVGSRATSTATRIPTTATTANASSKAVVRQRCGQAIRSAAAAIVTAARPGP
jgi:hypothetical protein